MSCLPLHRRERQKPNRVETADRLDVIIFGASGFAGRNTVLEAVDILKDLRWGVAGRNRHKLEAVMDAVSNKACINISTIPIIIADIEDFDSVVAMTGKCRIVVNCCGPYQSNGETVIEACLATGTHHVDMSYESNYMELKYNLLAQESKVYIVSGCGFQFMPLEMGINFVTQQFNGTVNFIEAYTEFWSAEQDDEEDVATEAVEGMQYELCAMASLAVWTSVVMAFSSIRDLKDIRHSLFPQPLPSMQPKIPKRGFIHNSEFVYGVCVPLHFMDPQAVVNRSQHHFYEKQYIRPIQFHNYIAFPNYFRALLFVVWCFCVVILAQFEYTRNMLLKHYKFFTNGMVSPRGPNEQCMENQFFRITFNAEGWPKSCANPSYEFEEAPCKQVVGRVSGWSPFYGVACVTLLLSAVTILQEEEKLPGSGGVLPPGAAFAHTNINAQLEKFDHGLTFEILEA